MNQKGIALIPIALIVTGILLFSTVTYFLATDNFQLTDLFKVKDYFSIRKTEKLGEPGGLQVENIQPSDTEEEIELNVIATTTRTETDYGQDESTESWQAYSNEEYGFEIKYPQNSKIVKEEDNFIEISLPREVETKLLDKTLTVIIRSEEYDQPVDYYCSQGIPASHIVKINGTNFCLFDPPEERTEGEWLFKRFFAYHTIYNKKWITLNFTLFYCLPCSTCEECKNLSDFDETLECDVFTQILSTFRFLD